MVDEIAATSTARASRMTGLTLWGNHPEGWPSFPVWSWRARRMLPLRTDYGHSGE